MNRELYNFEGYPDLTHFQATLNIRSEERQKRFRPIVYICSPYSGDVEANTEAARRYCRYAVDQGCIPVAPHLLFPQFMDDSNMEERELALFMDLALLSKCRELWVFGDTISRGMKREIDKAHYRCIPVRHFTTDCEEVSSHA